MQLVTIWEPPRDAIHYLAMTLVAPLIIAFSLGIVFSITMFAPEILKQDLGILPFIIIPACILIAGYFLIITVAYCSAIELPTIRLVYSVLLTFLLTQPTLNSGLFGESTASVFIVIGLLFFALFILFKIALKSKIATRTIKSLLIAILGTAATYFLVVMSVHISIPAGWAKRSTLNELLAYSENIQQIFF